LAHQARYRTPNPKQANTPITANTVFTINTPKPAKQRKNNRREPEGYNREIKA
jgi:hypothetical protein